MNMPEARISTVDGGHSPAVVVHAGVGKESPVQTGAPEDARDAARMLFDLSGIDLSRRQASRADIERYIPHRGELSLLDAVVWTDAGNMRGVGLIQVRHDAFWVKGHFPGMPIMPGVLMVEAGAQLSCYLYNLREGAQKVVAFLKIEDCTFRSRVVPGDDFYILCNEVRFGKRRFVSDVQGMVGGKVAYDARITGFRIE